MSEADKCSCDTCSCTSIPEADVLRQRLHSIAVAAAEAISKDSDSVSEKSAETYVKIALSHLPLLQAELRMTRGLVYLFIRKMEIDGFNGRPLKAVEHDEIEQTIYGILSEWKHNFREA